MEIKTPEISVVIPLYNKAPYIKRALDSVLMQTVQDFEIIVVGGNSTDSGENIVLSYSDSRIRFVKEAGKGVSAARNQGVDAARAELVAFLDADDEWHPNFLETILYLRKQYSDAGLYGTGYIIKSTNNSEQLIVYNKDKEHQIITNFFSVKNQHGMIICTSGTVIPKDIFKKSGGFPVGYQQNEDRYLRARISLDYPVAYSPNVCVNYYLDPETYYNRSIEQFINDMFSNYVEENIEILKKDHRYNDIQLFCDLARISTSMMNIRGKHPRQDIRKILMKISSPNLSLHKQYYIFLSYLPYGAIKIIGPIVSLFWHIIQKSILYIPQSIVKK